MPSINNQPVLPGVFSQVQQQLLASVTGGIRVVAYIGTGRLTNLVTGEAVVRGSGNDDALAHTATVLDGTTITDANYATYDLGVDYSLSGGGIAWSTGTAMLTGTTHDPYSNLSGLTFQLSVAGGPIQTITFPSETTASAAAGTLNTYFTGHSIAASASTSPYSFSFTVTSVPDSTHLIVVSTTGMNAGDTITQGANTTTITTVTDSTHLVVGDTTSWTAGTAIDTSSVDNQLVISTTGTFNTSLTIENGTANSILGFVAGSLVSAPSRPALGVTYYANYEWAKALNDGQGSFQPQFYFVQNFATITNAVGSVGGTDSQTANMNGAWTLPIAAQLAQLNGASIVCLMQMNPADGSNASQVRAALQKLFIPNINIVVSLDAADNAMLIPDITAHVETASSTINRLERTAFIGFPDGTNVSDTSIALGYATAASSNRVVIVNQTSTTYSMFIGTNQTASVVDGTMMAASLAALRTNPAFDVAQPLTREVVSGIATTNTLAQAAKVILSNAGVLIVDNISGSAKVVFGTTSEFDTILNQLYQVTEITDYVAQTLRGLLDPIFIGQKLLANTPSQVETVSGAILQTIEDSDIIESFIQPTATVNPSQPTQILLNCAITPVLELDSVLITLGLNLV